MEDLGRAVLIDMDDTIADFRSALLETIPQDQHRPRTGFHIAKDYPLATQEIMNAECLKPGFFEDLKPMPGILEAWQIMLDHGYQPRIASAPHPKNPMCIDEKTKWLTRELVPEFGSKVVEDAIFDAEKWKYHAIAIIDDRPDIHRGFNGEETAEWSHILFGWSHLETVNLSRAAFRLVSWQDKGNLISMLDTIRLSK